MPESVRGNQVFAAQTSIVLPQYLTTLEADRYFYARLDSEVWLNASEQDKQAALIQSTRAIDNLNFLGVKFKPDQYFAFPRWQPDPYASFVDSSWPAIYTQVEQPTVTPSIPQDILIACCENAIVLLDGFDFEIELSTLNSDSTSFAGVRETYDRRLAVSHLKAGIASALAWQRLVPWLADTNSFTLSRVN